MLYFARSGFVLKILTLTGSIDRCQVIDCTPCQSAKLLTGLKLWHIQNMPVRSIDDGVQKVT